MAPHSTTLAWKIPWTEELGRLQSMGSLRVRHDWATSLSLFTFMHWRRKWQPTPVFLPGESQGWVGCRLWGRPESDTTEATQQQQQHPLQYSWASLAAQLVKNPSAMWEIQVRSLGWEDPLENGKANHSSILAWGIPWTLQSIRSQRAGHDFHFHFMLLVVETTQIFCVLIEGKLLD